MKVGVSGVLVKIILCEILARLIGNLTKHAKLINI